MNDKMKILVMLNDEFKRWEELLARLTEKQAAQKLLPSDWSIKDNMAHLMAWQQRTIAREQAALHDRAPEFPKWPESLDPNADDVDKINAWIYETNRERPWSSVYRDWRAGYLRFLELAQAVPENDLLDPVRYAWLEGYSLAQILEASYDHHQEHLESLQTWLSQHGDINKNQQVS